MSLNQYVTRPTRAFFIFGGKKGESSQVSLPTDLKLNLLKVVSIGKRSRRIDKIEKTPKKLAMHMYCKYHFSKNTNIRQHRF